MRPGRHQRQEQSKQAPSWPVILLRLLALWLGTLVATAVCLAAVGRTGDFAVVATIASVFVGSLAAGGSERAPARRERRR